MGGRPGCVALAKPDPLEQGQGVRPTPGLDPAADCYAKAVNGDATNDGHVWFEYAAVLLLAGDSPGYVRACGSRMIERVWHAGGRPAVLPRGPRLHPGS